MCVEGHVSIEGMCLAGAHREAGYPIARLVNNLQEQGAGPSRVLTRLLVLLQNECCIVML